MPWAAAGRAAVKAKTTRVVRMPRDYSISLVSMRHTKIIATVGPASADSAVLDALIAAGVDVFRLNFSHGTQAEHAAAFDRIRAAAARAGRHVAILQDLSGPKIRTGRLVGGKADPAEAGDPLVIAIGDEVAGPAGSSTTYGGSRRSVRRRSPAARRRHVELRVESATARGDPHASC